MDINKFNSIITKLADFYKNSEYDYAKLDLRKKEDCDMLIDTIDDILSNNSNFLSDDIIDFFNTMKYYAQKIYNDAHKNDNIPSKPSDEVDDAHKQKFNNLVTDYINEKIIPAKTLNDKQISALSNALFEFACWIYLK